MNNIAVKAGTADVSVVIRIIDSTDGTPETGVAYNTSGIDLQYRRELAASTPITEATLAALTTAHADGGFLHIGNGYYRLDLPDAACAAGATGVLVHGTVTGMVVIGCYIQLVAYDPFDTVRLGLTALPNAAAEAAGGLYTRGTGAGQIAQDANGNVRANVDTIKTNPVVNGGTVTFPTGATLASTTNITAGTIATVTTLTNLPSIPSNWLTAAGIAASALNGKGDWNVGKTGYTLTATTGLGNQTANITGNLSGSVGSVTGAVGSVTGAVGSVTGAVGSVTGNVGGNVTGSVGSVTGAVGSVTGAVGSVTGAVGSVASGGITEASFATTAGSFYPMGVVDQGQAQSAGATTLVLRSAAGFANDELIGATIVITGGSAGVGQARVITDYVNSTDTATVDTWTVTPTGTITYKVFAGPPAPTTPPAVNVTQVIGDPIVASSAKTTNWGGTA